MISQEQIQLARLLELQARKKADHILAGNFKSAFHGEGLEFNEVRPYQSQDDVRRIDWNVTARTGSPYIKTFFEDRNINLVVTLDISNSMNFGSIEKTKRDIAIEITTLLLLVGVFQKHKVQLVVYSEDIDLYLPLKSNQADVLKALSKVFEIINQREAMPAHSQTTDFETLVSFIGSVVRKRGIVFHLSDFLSLAEPRIFQRLNKKFKQNFLALSDPLESEHPATTQWGKLLIEDAEMATNTAASNLARPGTPAPLADLYPLNWLEVSSRGFTLESLVLYLNRKQHFHKAS